MAKFYVFTFSGSTMMMKLSLQMVKGPDDDKQFAFFKSRTLYMPYGNQPAETLDGTTIDFTALEGDWLLVVPRDVVPHLMGSNLRSMCTHAADVEVSMLDQTSMANALLKFIHTNWDDLTYR